MTTELSDLPLSLQLTIILRTALLSPVFRDQLVACASAGVHRIPSWPHLWLFLDVGVWPKSAVFLDSWSRPSQHRQRPIWPTIVKISHTSPNERLRKYSDLTLQDTCCFGSVSGETPPVFWACFSHFFFELLLLLYLTKIRQVFPTSLQTTLKIQGTLGRQVYERLLILPSVHDITANFCIREVGLFIIYIAQDYISTDA